MAERVDVAIVGGGLMGAAAAWARRGAACRSRCSNSSSPGITRGSSHGSARIVRRGYSDALYTRLTGRGVRAVARGRAHGRQFACCGWSAEWTSGRTARALVAEPARRGRVPHEVLAGG